MSLVLFYHLTRSAPEETVISLLERAVGKGWRVMVRGRDTAGLERLDRQLWLGPKDGFLPHALQSGTADAVQPILLGSGAITNDARALMLVDGAEVSLAETETLERVWIIFDGADPVALDRARGQWKSLTDAGLAAQYWSEQSGAWVKKAEKGG